MNWKDCATIMSDEDNTSSASSSSDSNSSDEEFELDEEAPKPSRTTRSQPVLRKPSQNEDSEVEDQASDSEENDDSANSTSDEEWGESPKKQKRRPLRSKKVNRFRTTGRVQRRTIQQRKHVNHNDEEDDDDSFDEEDGNQSISTERVRNRRTQAVKSYAEVRKHAALTISPLTRLCMAVKSISSAIVPSVNEWLMFF